MTRGDLLSDAFSRVREEVHAAVAGLSPAELAFRAAPDANSIAWLVWHLTRIQDDHLAHARHTGQLWLTAGWAERFGLPFDAAATGYGQRSDDVAAVRADGGLLTGYYDAVHDQTIRYISGLADADLDRIVDDRWDPPVTLGVRLVSVMSDDLQHAGQAAFICGLIAAQRPRSGLNGGREASAGACARAQALSSISQA